MAAIIDSNANEFTAEFDTFVADLMRQWDVLGLSIAIIRDNDITTKGYGIVKPGGRPVTADTMFDTASLGKSFTAAAVALLVQDENLPELQWNTPVSRLIPDDFVLRDPYLTQNVNIVDILSHRTGIPGHDEAVLSPRASSPDTPKTICRKLRHLDCTKPFRTEFQYNSLMYAAAAHLLESLTNLTLPQLLTERFWTPLGMHNTSFGRDPDAVRSGEISAGYVWDSRSGSQLTADFVEGPAEKGSGGIVASVADWARWVRAHIQGTTGLLEETAQQLFEPRIFSHDDSGDEDTDVGGPTFHAMGWNVGSYSGEKMLYHDGAVPGFTACAGFLPHKKLGFVFLSNADQLSYTSEALQYRILDDLLQKPPNQRRQDWDKYMLDEHRKWEARKYKEPHDPYPNRSSVSLPTPVGLEAYTGTFTNAAYGALAVILREGSLFIDGRDRAFPLAVHFEHVTASFFTAHVRELPGWDSMRRLRAEFRVGVGGDVRDLGIDFLDDDESDLVWFERVYGA